MSFLLSIFKLFPPELSHSLALYSLKLLYKLKLINILFPRFKNQEFSFLGMTFSNRLGTAAGLDKNGDFIDPIGSLKTAPPPPPPPRRLGGKSSPWHSGESHNRGLARARGALRRALIEFYCVKRAPQKRAPAAASTKKEKSRALAPQPRSLT